jgi:hypothetical protein
VEVGSGRVLWRGGDQMRAAAAGGQDARSTMLESE